MKHELHISGSRVMQGDLNMGGYDILGGGHGHFTDLDVNVMDVNTLTVLIFTDGTLTITGGTIDLGTNTIYDENMTGNWDLNSGNLTNVDIDSGTVDGITTLGLANSVDVGNYTITANGLTIDGTFTDGFLSIASGNITMAPTKWIGLGAASDRVIFDSGRIRTEDTLIKQSVDMGDITATGLELDIDQTDASAFDERWNGLYINMQSVAEGDQAETHYTTGARIWSINTFGIYAAGSCITHGVEGRGRGGDYVYGGLFIGDDGASTSGSAYCYGVIGLADDGTTGNIGVYGRADSETVPTAIAGDWAGYFEGNVNVTGSVTADSFITAGNIGITGDTDILQLAAKSLTVNAALTVAGNTGVSGSIVGKAITLTAGAGFTDASPGAGGAITATSGAGGATTNGNSEDGGNFNFTSGNGGAITSITGSTAGISGNSGSFTFTSGDGGVITGVASTSGAVSGGAAGTMNFVGGVGANAIASSTNNIGGAGGSLTFSAGNGGLGVIGTGGAGGIISFDTGAGGSGTVANGEKGAIYLKIDGTNVVKIDKDKNTLIGDGGTTNHIAISPTGDLVFIGTAGLPYGCIEGMDETVTCTDEDVWYQVTFDAAGPVNLIEADTANNELEVTYEGVYQVSVVACFHTNPSNDFELLVKKQDGTVDLEPHLFQTTAVADKVENAAGTCLIDINANDRVELWIMCTSAAGQDVVFDHVSLTLTQVGGT